MSDQISAVVALECYCVELEIEEGDNSKAIFGEGFLRVEDGCFHVIAKDLAEVGIKFPQALRVTRIGLGYKF